MITAKGSVCKWLNTTHEVPASNHMINKLTFNIWNLKLLNSTINREYKYNLEEYS